jgi:hypothetical protein
METQLMFLDCPAYLDRDGSQRCGLPAEVRCRFIMRSTDGPLESAMIRCPAGHSFNGPVEFLTLKTQRGAAVPGLPSPPAPAGKPPPPAEEMRPPARGIQRPQ